MPTRPANDASFTPKYEILDSPILLVAVVQSTSTGSPETFGIALDTSKALERGVRRSTTTESKGRDCRRAGRLRREQRSDTQPPMNRVFVSSAAAIEVCETTMVADTGLR